MTSLEYIIMWALLAKWFWSSDITQGFLRGLLQ